MSELATLRNLLGDKNTVEMGFDMAKTMFSDKNVQYVLINWYTQITSIVKDPNLYIPRLSESIKEYIKAVYWIVPRVERFLQLMELIDDDGRTIEDINNTAPWLKYGQLRY